MLSRASIAVPAGTNFVVEGTVDFLQSQLVSSLRQQTGKVLTSCSVPKMEAK